MVTDATAGGRGALAPVDRLEAVLDDAGAVANAGLILPATLADRLGLEDLVEELVDLGERPGGARPGAKVMTLVHALLAGADSIDDCDLLRSASTRRVLGHRVMAPSTLGTFLRSFTFGHGRQLDRWPSERWPAPGPLAAGRLASP